MNTRKLVAIGIVSLLAAYGCSTSDAEDRAPDQENSEDQLQGFKGTVDNAAIVEATTMMLTAPISLPPLDPALDQYNQAKDPFNIGGAPYRPVFARNLVKFDL